MINSLKDLDKLMLLCRKRGIKTFKIDNIEFTIEQDPQPKAKSRRTYIPDTFDPGPMPTPQVLGHIDEPDALTDEQRLFGSSDPSVWETN